MNSAVAIEFVAHRAGLEKGSENTISAIKYAIDTKVAFIEIDVHLSADKHIIVLHDKTLNRTTNGPGKVSTKTLKQLKELDVGSKYHQKFKGEKIPTLSEVLELDFKNSRLIIEVKNSYDVYPGIEKLITEKVKKSKNIDNIIYKAFSRDSLKRFHTLHPEADFLYVIIGPITDWLLIDDFLRFKNLFDLDFINFYQVHRFFVTKKLVKEVHRREKRLIVWDVHTKEEVEKFKSMQVDIIETDFPNRF